MPIPPAVCKQPNGCIPSWKRAELTTAAMHKTASASAPKTFPLRMPSPPSAGMSPSRPLKISSGSPIGKANQAEGKNGYLFRQLPGTGRSGNASLSYGFRARARTRARARNYPVNGYRQERWTSAYPYPEVQIEMIISALPTWKAIESWRHIR